MNAVYNSEDTTLKSTVESLILQHGLLRVLATLLARTVRGRTKTCTITAQDLSAHLRRDIGL